MSKKLTLSHIKEEVKIYSQKQKVQLSDEYHVHIYPHFAPSKIGEMIKEIIQDKLNAEKVGINFENINMIDWVYFNIIKYFTDLEIPNDIKKKVQAYLFLRDSEYFPTIVNSFPKENIDRVSEAMKRFGENLDAISQMNEKELEKLIDNTVNEDNAEESVG